MAEALREGYWAPKVVYVDGQGGSGKTMLSPILATLARMEKLTYSYDSEHICAFHFLNKISLDAASTYIRLTSDVLIYNLMMSRDINFRPSDLSSVFKDVHTFKYLKRMFMKGDLLVPERIVREKPILHLTTHNVLGFSEPVFAALGDRVVFVEVVRHPLYMIKQQTVNMESIIGTVRDLTVYVRYRQHPVHYHVQGWEDLYLRSNPTERAIYSIENLYRITERSKAVLRAKYSAQIITVPFEDFVLRPEGYLRALEQSIGTHSTPLTSRMLKRQKVPRKMIADGLDLKIYRRFGWRPPKASTEREELAHRRTWVKERVDADALETLDRISAEYETRYWPKGL